MSPSIASVSEPWIMASPPAATVISTNRSQGGQRRQKVVQRVRGERHQVQNGDPAALQAATVDRSLRPLVPAEAQQSEPEHRRCCQTELDREVHPAAHCCFPQQEAQPDQRDDDPDLHGRVAGQQPGTRTGNSTCDPARLCGLRRPMRRPLGSRRGQPRPGRVLWSSRRCWSGARRGCRRWRWHRTRCNGRRRRCGIRFGQFGRRLRLSLRRFGRRFRLAFSLGHTLGCRVSCLGRAREPVASFQEPLATSPMWWTEIQSDAGLRPSVQASPGESASHETRCLVRSNSRWQPLPGCRPDQRPRRRVHRRQQETAGSTQSALAGSMHEAPRRLGPRDDTQQRRAGPAART